MTGAAHGIPRHERGPMLDRLGRDNPQALLAYVQTLDLRRIDGGRVDYADLAGLGRADLIDLALKAEYPEGDR